MIKEIITQRLKIRPFILQDFPFILEITNDEDFMTMIGDKGIRSPDDAEKYLLQGPLKSYDEHGFGLMAIDLLTTGQTIGLCGLIQRSFLPIPDLGFALLKDHRRMGYGFESGTAIGIMAFRRLGIKEIGAISKPNNKASLTLLKKLGFKNAKRIFSPEGEKLLYLTAQKM